MKVNGFYKKNLSVTLTLIIMVFIPYYKASSQGNNIVAETPEWMVNFNEILPCDNCIIGREFSFTAVSKADDSSTNFIVESAASTLTSLYIYQSILLVRGQLPYGGDSVVFVDLEEKRKDLEIYAYNMHFSPDYRYLIYQKYYPRFSSDHRSTIMLYDLENQRENVEQFSTYRPEDVGYPVYPEQDTQTGGSVNYQGAPPFSLDNVLWNNEEQYVALPVLDDNSYLNLLIVGLWSGIDTQEFSVCHVPLVPAIIDTQYSRRPSKNVVESLEAISRQSIQIFLYENNGIRREYTIHRRSACL